MTRITEARREIRGIADISRIHARHQPGQVATIFEGKNTTYGELDERASRIAGGLAAEGLRAESRFAYLGKNTDIFYQLYFGGTKAGAVLTPVNWRLSAEEILYIINDSDSELLFVTEDFAAVAAQLAAGAPKLRKIIPLAQFDDWLARHPAIDPNLPILPDDVVVQIYTSGTTGRPKGAQLTNRSTKTALGRVDSGEYGNWDETTYALAPLPGFHIAGLGWAALGLYAGGTTVIQPEVNPQRIIDAFRTMPIAKLGIVPAVMQIILDHPDCAAINFDSLERISYGGSAISPALLKRAIETFRCNFVQLFGMTESNAFGTFLPPEDHDLSQPEKLLSCGKISSLAQLRIIAPDGATLKPGQPGEILLKGDMIMKGYWKRPEAIQDGWYHTGDIGVVDENGYLYIRDRIKDMIISGGENIYSSEVENALSGHPDVSEVAVIGVPDEKWGESVKAIVIRKPGSDVTAEALIRHARERIAHYKCPKSIAFADALPRNAGGKVLKRMLRDQYQAG